MCIIEENKMKMFGESHFPHPPPSQGSYKLCVCMGQELCLQTWLDDSGRPHSGWGGTIGALQGLASTSQPWARTQGGGQVGSPGWTPPLWQGKAEQKPYQREILALILGSGHTHDIISVHEFPFLSLHSKLAAKAGFGPQGRQVRALEGSLLQKPWLARTLHHPEETIPISSSCVLFLGTVLFITASPFPLGVVRAGFYWGSNLNILQKKKKKKKVQYCPLSQLQTGKEVVFQSWNSSLKKGRTRIKMGHSVFRVKWPFFTTLN